MNMRCLACGWTGDEIELVGDTGHILGELDILDQEDFDEGDYYRCPDCYSEDVVDED